MIQAGIDVGTRFLKICVAEDGSPPGFACREMRGRFHELYDAVLHEAIADASAKTGTRLRPRDVKRTVATGFGAHLVKKARRTVSDAVSTARGVRAVKPEVRTIVDAGGLFIRVIEIGDTGLPSSVLVNEKCAAGSGRFLETVSAAMGVPFPSISDHAGASTSPVGITSSCAVFAESDIISLLNAGGNTTDILAGVVDSIAAKTVTLIEAAGTGSDIALVGGLALVGAYAASLRRLSGRNIIALPMDPRMAGAYGAALLARDKAGGR